MVVYLETSALLAWLFGETTAEAVRRTVDEAETVVTSVMTVLEAQRSLVRAERAGHLAPADRQRLRGLLARVQREWTTMEVSAEVRETAGGRFPVEPLRTRDGIHLSTALAFARSYPDLQVLSLDRWIVMNATAVGLALSPASSLANAEDSSSVQKSSVDWS